MSTPADSVAPAPPTGTSNPWSLVQWWKRICDWIAALSPSGATEYHTGWVDITPAAGFTAGTGVDAPQVCRVGRQILFRGFISGPLTTSGATIGTIPAGYRARTLNDAATAGALTNGGTCRIATGTSGAIVVHVSSNVTTGASLKALSGYLVD